MKKLIFFVVFVCLSSFVHSQSSHSLGLNTSYSFKNSEWLDSQSPNFGLTHNYFFNQKHGIVTELGLNQTKWSFSVQMSFFTENLKLTDYNSNLSLHYIFKPNQFFIKSGFNLQGFNLVRVWESSSIDELQGQVFTAQSKTVMSFEKSQMKFTPEFHLGLGRDFDLGKVNIRVNGFVERALSNNEDLVFYHNPFNFGLSTGVFYQFGK